MKGLIYNIPHDVSVTDVEDPRIERPTDVLVGITRTNICGSDLHMYEGRTDMEAGRVLGHENLGEVVETGTGVGSIKVGDMVSVPVNVACGHCKNCERGLTNYCLAAQPKDGFACAAYGFADMGPWRGGRAEYLRVPWGDFNCLRLPEDAHDKQNDYVMLSDIWPTGYHATERANVGPGEQVRSVRFTGSLGVVGVFVPEDPGAPDDLARHGQVAFDYGTFWFKDQRMGSGQCPVKRYNRQLRDLIHVGKAKPSWLVSHQLLLTSAPDAYEHFDRRDRGWTKVVLSPVETNGGLGR
jgi:threonine dehydrogenase-like Zn-dependent dehydrogenase